MKTALPSWSSSRTPSSGSVSSRTMSQSCSSSVTGRVIWLDPQNDSRPSQVSRLFEGELLPFCSRAIFRTFSLKSDRTLRYGITALSSCRDHRRSSAVWTPRTETDLVQNCLGRNFRIWFTGAGKQHLLPNVAMRTIKMLKYNWARQEIWLKYFLKLKQVHLT